MVKESYSFKTFIDECSYQAVIDYLSAKDFLEEVESESTYNEIRSGFDIVHEDYFEKYVENNAPDITGLGSLSNEWPYNCIDWRLAAKRLQDDWVEVTWNKETYLMARQG